MSDKEMQSAPTTIKLNYRFPVMVESVRQGRISTYTLTSIITALFAVMEVAFLAAFDPITTLPSTTCLRGSTSIHNFFAVVSYAALIFNVSATVSAVFLMDILGSLAFLRKDEPEQVPKTARRLLKAFGAEGLAYSGTEWHWYISFILGLTCVFAQLLTYIWLHETNLIGVVLTIAAVYCILPLIFMII